MPMLILLKPFKLDLHPWNSALFTVCSLLFVVCKFCDQLEKMWFMVSLVSVVHIHHDILASMGKKARVKFSSFRFRALSPAVGCHYFPPGLQVPSQPKSVTAHWPVSNYTACDEAPACEQLAQDCHLEADRPRFEPTTFWVTSECCTVTQHRHR